MNLFSIVLVSVLVVRNGSRERLKCVLLPTSVPTTTVRITIVSGNSVKLYVLVISVVPVELSCTIWRLAVWLPLSCGVSMCVRRGKVRY